MTEKNQIVSLSGGKDSTAMLLMMLERGEKVHSAVFFDTGWEFPQMHDHIEKLTAHVWERYRIRTWTLHPLLPLEYYMLHKPIVARQGPDKGKVHKIGWGWPTAKMRWCTGRKLAQIEYFQKQAPDIVACVGYAADEEDRVKEGSGAEERHPLIEWGITEADALEYCRDKGFHWDGLYDLFDRVSCFCCPLKRIGDLRILRKRFPDLWGKMLEWDKLQPDHVRGFKDDKTIHDLDRRFAEEDRQMVMFSNAI